MSELRGRLLLSGELVSGRITIEDGLVASVERGPVGGTDVNVFHSHGREHRIVGGTAYYPPREPGGAPQLAGSASAQLEMVRKLVSAGVCGPADALVMASETPARALGLGEELGVLRAGARADLIVLRGDDLELREAWVAGVRVPRG